MSQNRSFLDWTSFSDNKAAFGLLNQSVRSALSFDFFAGKRKFNAIAVETAVNLTPLEADGYGAHVDVSSGNKVAAFIFKARIIDENSPHSFLPDPCALAQAGDKEAAIAAVKQHTTFVSYNDPQANLTSVVNTGDIVEVELEKGAFSYNLQQGRFIRVVQRGPASTYSGTSCQSIADHFGVLPLYGPGMPNINAGNSVSTDDVEGITFSSGVDLFQGQKDFLTRLRTMISPTTPIHVTSGYRSPERQAAAMLNIWTGTGEGELRRLYRKPLVTEVMAAGKNVSSMATVIQGQVDRRQYLSRHLYKAGLDLRSKNLTDAQVAEIVSAARSLGAKVGMEPGSCWTNKGQSTPRLKSCGNEHIHIGVPEDYMEGRYTTANDAVTDAAAVEDDQSGTADDGDTTSHGKEGADWKWIDEAAGDWEWIPPAPPATV